MGMMLLCSMRPSQEMSTRQEMSTCGGLSDSCLPRAQMYLEEHQHVLLLLRKRLARTRYESVMDGVLCGFFPHLKKPCVEYYTNDGPPLREYVSEKALKALDKHLLNSLKVLHKTYEDIAAKELWSKGKGHDSKSFKAALAAIGWKS